MSSANASKQKTQGKLAKF